MAYEQLLEQIGLSTDEAKVYETLLKNGIMPAGNIPLKCGLKRGLVYKILTSLEKQGFIEKIDSPGKVALFSVTHPGKLREKLLKKEEENKAAEAALGGIMGSLVSDYNLFKGKPNVQFFEGVAGIEKVLDDSLYATEEIYSYADGESVVKYIPEINKKYVADREKLKIKKKIIIFDTENAQKIFKDFHETITEIKFISCKTSPFQSVMQIYNNKVSYITLSEKEMIGLIVEDPHIYSMHRFMFEKFWALTPLSDPDTNPPSPKPVSSEVQSDISQDFPA